MKFKKEMRKNSVSGDFTKNALEFKVAKTIYDTLFQAYRPYLASIFFLLILGLAGRFLLLSTSRIIAERLDDGEITRLASIENLLGPLAISLFLSVAFTISYRVLFSRLSALAVSKIYDETTFRVSRFALTFFDENPVGKIMSRFSSDYGNVFRLFGGPLAEFLSIIFDLVCIVLINAWISPWFVPPQILAFCAFFAILKKNQKQLRDGRNQMSLLRGPSVSHFSETVQGATDIRLAKKNEVFARRFVQLDQLFVNSKKKVFNRVFIFSTQLNVMNFILFIINGLISLVLIKNQVIGMSEATVVMAYTVFSTQALQMFFEWFSQFDEALIGLQRMDEYLRTPLEPEATLPAYAQFSTGHPQADEGDSGNLKESPRLVVDNLHLGYKIGDALVLKGIHLNILPGEKIGIIGKTGAGKSSLISAILKLYPFEKGRIIMANDPGMTLARYRRQFSVVSQETFFIKGTLRDNLDIAEQHPDQEILEILNKVGIFLELSYAIKERGANLSQGEKQLISLARALLKKSNVVIFDEATANVDPASEKHLVEILTRELKDKTQIIIAHRLTTVEKCDRVAWIENGVVKKIGPPKEVLEAFRAPG